MAKAPEECESNILRELVAYVHASSERQLAQQQQLMGMMSDVLGSLNLVQASLDSQAYPQRRSQEWSNSGEQENDTDEDLVLSPVEVEAADEKLRVSEPQASVADRHKALCTSSSVLESPVKALPTVREVAGDVCARNSAAVEEQLVQLFTAEHFTGPATRSSRTSWSEIPSWRQGLVPCISGYATRVVMWTWFESIVGIIILINIGFIGADSVHRVRGTPSAALDIVEHVFLSIYACELTLRFTAHGTQCFQQPFFVFDSVLVGFGCIAQAVTDTLATEIEDSAYADKILLLRVLRILRVLRAFRLIPGFETLWKLIHGVVSSASTMLSSFLVAALIVYLAACVAVEILTLNESVLANDISNEIISEFFPDLFTSMLTLIAFLNNDSTHAIYAPLIQEHWWLALYFLPLTMVVSICLMNIITATLVEAAIVRSAEDRELQRREFKALCRKMIPATRAAFKLLDVNGDGGITFDELRERMSDLPEVLTARIDAHHLLELFEYLDLDHTGVIQQAEFVDAIGHILTTDAPLELLEIKKMLRAQGIRFCNLERELRARKPVRELVLPAKQNGPALPAKQTECAPSAKQTECTPPATQTECAPPAKQAELALPTKQTTLQAMAYDGTQRLVDCVECQSQGVSL